MTIPVVLFLVALVLALVELLRSRGESLVAWAALLIAIGLIWGHLP